MPAKTRGVRAGAGTGRASTVAPEALIDRARWPVTDLEAPATKRIVATEQRRLAKELAVETFQTYAHGQSIYYSGGQRKTYRGGIPPASPAVLISPTEC